jgi:hypothetical protein
MLWHAVVALRVSDVKIAACSMQQEGGDLSCTVQRSTARHGTARHGIAQRSLHEPGSTHTSQQCAALGSAAKHSSSGQHSLQCNATRRALNGGSGAHAHQRASQAAGTGQLLAKRPGKQHIPPPAIASIFRCHVLPKTSDCKRSKQCVAPIVFCSMSGGACIVHRSQPACPKLCLM